MLTISPFLPTQEQKCRAIIRAQVRKIDRDINQIKNVEIKTKNLILQANKRGQRDPTRQKQAAREARDFARELIHARKTEARLVTTKAQIQSVGMQIQNAVMEQQVVRILGSSVKVMVDSKDMVRLPELALTMRQVSAELTKAGIVNEMVEDMLPDTDLLEDEDEAEEEIEKVLGEILKDRMKTGALPSVPLPQEAAPAQAEEEDEEDTEAMMDQMRNRLEALRS